MTNEASGRFAAAVRGEDWAQESLVEEIRDLAQRVCRSLRQSWPESFDWEDVAQEAARHLFAYALERYRGEGSERSYLYTVIRVTLLQMLRETRRRKAREESVGSESAAPVEPDSDRVLARSLIERSDPECRDLLREVFFDGTPYRTLAEQRHLAESSVRSKVSRCLRKLREDEEGHEPG